MTSEQDKFNRDIAAVRKLSTDDMPAFPEHGHQLGPEERALQMANTVRPIVSVHNEDGSTPASEGQKLVSDEQLKARLNNEDAPYSSQNPTFTNIGPELPSCMAFYPGNSLSIQTFKTPHIIKLIEAMELNDFGKIVDVVTSVLEPGFSALALTLDDFFYVLYWLKINSFQKHPMEIPFHCNNKEHLSKVVSGVMPKESLQNVVIIKEMGNLTVEYMTEEKLAAATEIMKRVKDKYDIDLFPMQMKDYVALQEYLTKTSAYAQKIIELSLKLEETGDISSPVLDKLKEEKNKIDAMYAMKDYAPYIILNNGASIIDKLNFLNNANLDADFLGEIDEFIASLSHGVTETVAVRCRGCNATIEVDVSIDALHFFPEIIRARFT